MSKIPVSLHGLTQPPTHNEIHLSSPNFPTERGAFKMAEEYNVEITFLSTNTSKIHPHVEQLLQNTY